MVAVGALLARVPLLWWLGGALVLSSVLNLHQCGKSYAAEAECRAAATKAQLDALEKYNEEQAKKQASVDKEAESQAKGQSKKLDAIVSSVSRTAEELRKAANANPTRSECRIPTDRMLVVNTALSQARAP